MILIFLPPMTELAVKGLRTTIFIKRNFSIRFPIFTRRRVKFFKKRPFIVLPVMGVNAYKSIMVNFAERTELSLKVKEQEISIDFHNVQWLYFKFFIRMSESTKLSEFTQFFFDKILAVLFLIVFRVINLFYKVVGKRTGLILTYLFIFAESFRISILTGRSSFF